MIRSWKIPEKLLLRFCLRVRFLVTGIVELSIEDGYVDVKSSRRVTAVKRVLAVWNQPGSAGGGNRRKPQVALRGRKTLRRFHIEVLANQFRAVLHCLLQQRSDVRRRRGRLRFVCKIERSLIRVSKGAGEFRERGLHVILRLNQQKLGLCQVHIRKTYVESGFQITFLEGAGLVGNQLTGFYGFLGDFQNGLRSERAEIGLIDAQQDVAPRGAGTFSCCAFACRFELFDKLIGPARNP